MGRPQNESDRVIWVVVKIMVPVWIPIIVRHLNLRYPKRDPNFDSRPDGALLAALNLNP